MSWISYCRSRRIEGQQVIRNFPPIVRQIGWVYYNWPIIPLWLIFIAVPFVGILLLLTGFP